MSTGKLRNTNPVHIAFRAIDLYRAYVEHGLTETVASAAAIGELKMELDDLGREEQHQPITRHDYEHPRGGFTSRSTLPRWLVELEGDSGEEERL